MVRTFLRRHYRRVLQLTLVTCIVFSALASIPHLLVARSSSGIFHRAQDTPNAQVAIVLGALVHEDGKPSMMFADRIRQSIQLYKLGHVQKILVSGDHGRTEYDEVNPAKQMLLGAGVKPQDIFLDHAGFDTYDSMARAKEVFGVKSAIAISQGFHLPRAIYTARHFGIRIWGLQADLHKYGENKAILYTLREEGAKMKAVLDVSSHAKPKFGGPKIPIEGDGRKSWD